MRKIGLIACLVFCVSTLKAQLGGTSTFAFLLNQPGARISALGGYAIATKDSDVNLLIQNPALLDSTFKNQLGYNHVSLFADIDAGDVTYAFKLNRKFNMAAGIQYVDYGSFNRTTPDGISMGTFTAGEYCYHLTTAYRRNEHLNYGMNVKFIYSNLESYNSTGLAADLAANYYIPKKRINLCVIASNIGSQITTYRSGNYEALPFNLQIGFSKKFEHNPLRISIIAHNLQNLGHNVYQIANRNNQNVSLETGLPIEEDLTVFKEVMSHMVFNSELILSRTFMIRLGYNYLRRREIGLTDQMGVAGFSWGIGLRISKFIISYGSASYMVNRATNHFSITIYPGEFIKKKNQL